MGKQNYDDMLHLSITMGAFLLYSHPLRTPEIFILYRRTQRMSKRTIIALLGVKKKCVVSRIKNREQPRHISVYCQSKNIARLFLKNAEKEGFTFGDGVLPTKREADDIFAINPDFTISYTGWVGHVMFKNSRTGFAGNIVRIDYGKYLSGARDYLM